jgi:serine/threonine protein kinase
VPGVTGHSLPDSLPEAVGRYRLRSRIGGGGMGDIFRGRDTDLGREIAFKVLREEHRDRAELTKRFIEEAQIGGQLVHPGIVPIYEVGSLTDHRPFASVTRRGTRPTNSSVGGRHGDPRWATN